MLTSSELKSLFKYAPETGIFTWKVDSGKMKAGSIAGSLAYKGYVRITINSKKYLAHRLAFLYMDGEFPEPGLQVDHINQVKNDNRWSNLRAVSGQENMRNRPMTSKNTSGCVGVCKHMGSGTWRAFIILNGHQKTLGYFNIYEDAVSARKAAEIKYGYHKNHGK